MQWVRADKGLSPGIGVLIDTTRLLNPALSDKPYYILVKGSRYYGLTPELTINPNDEQEWGPDSSTPGIGINIDMQRVLNNRDKKYYIMIDGQRCYGSNPANVLTNARLRENYVSDSGLSGGAVLIDTQKLLQSDPAPYFMGVNGQCIYGNSADSIIASVGSGNQGVKCPKTGVSAVMLDEDYLSSLNTDMNRNAYYILINGWRAYGKSPENVLETVKKNLAQLKNPANPGLFSRAVAATRRAGKAMTGAVSRTFKRKSSSTGVPLKSESLSGVAPDGSRQQSYREPTQSPRAEPTFTAYQTDLATKFRPSAMDSSQRRMGSKIPDYSPTNVDNFARKFPTSVNAEGNEFFKTPYGRHKQNNNKRPMFDSTTGFPVLVNKSGNRVRYDYRTTPTDYTSALQRGGSGRRTYKRHKGA
jgi:hypothetical protein